jgi:hypothetical protein
VTAARAGSRGRRGKPDVRWGVWLGVVGVVLLAFVVSFVFGLFSPAPPVVDSPAVTAADRPAEGERVRVEVLNASGRAGLARSVTAVLREAGFDVVFYGNAPASFSRDSSVVLDRVGRLDSARAVGRRLGIREVRSEVDGSRFVDVTVVVGGDWGT